jgi:hypothetical protein
MLISKEHEAENKTNQMTNLLSLHTVDSWVDNVLEEMLPSL